MKEQLPAQQSILPMHLKIFSGVFQRRTGVPSVHEDPIEKTTTKIPKKQ
jgi:hypothetical protein